MSVMTARPAESFGAALASDRPSEALASTARTLLKEGQTSESLIKVLEEVRERLIMDRRFDDEDLILDLMDRLAGWVGPHAAIR